MAGFEYAELQREMYCSNC